MSDRIPPPLALAYQRIMDRMSRRLNAAERDEVKASIVALFHDTDATLSEIGEFKESIRDLIARFKALPPAAEGAPPPAAPPVASVRHDHLGASSHIERGWSAIAAAHWVDAETHLRRAVALDGTSATALALLAWALMYRGSGEIAVDLCNDALTAQPDHGLARVVLGALALRRGDVGEASDWLQQVLRRGGDPRAMLYANYWLGVAHLDRNAPGEAEEVLRRAVTLGPNLAEGWLELGHALWQRDRTGEARDAWQRGARIQTSPFAIACRQMLDLAATGGTPKRSGRP